MYKIADELARAFIVTQESGVENLGLAGKVKEYERKFFEIQKGIKHLIREGQKNRLRLKRS